LSLRWVAAAGVVVAAVVALLLVASGDSDGTGPDPAFGAGPDDLLPDLATARARGLRIEADDEVRRLRFTHEIQNVGEGPLEIHPVASDCGDDEIAEDYGAEQWIFRDADGDGAFDRETDTEHSTATTGCLIYHRQHDHWHIDDFVSYELYRIGRGGEVAAKPVATSPKVSFCTVDSVRRNPEMTGAPDSSVYQAVDALPGDCEEGTTIGMSVGYADLYRAGLVDQWIDIEGVTDGDYCLVTATDVRGIVPEVRERNNEQRRRLELRGDEVRSEPYRLC
jgi:Lysyl oxidase